MFLLKSKNLKKFSCKFFSTSNFQIEKGKDFLRIRDITTKDYFDYHYFWLRHNCICEKGCVHPFTKEKILRTTDFPLSIAPLDINLAENNLTITWDDERKHITTLNIDSILQYNYSKNRIEVPPQNFTLNDIEIDYSSYANNKPKYIQALGSGLANFDIVVVRNYGLDTESIINDLGNNLIESHFGRYEDLMTNNTTNKNTDQLGYTNAAIDLHTDLPFIAEPPGMQLLQCIQPAIKGGSNYFVNSKQISLYLNTIDPRAFYLLSNYSVCFDRKQKNYHSKYITPIINLKKGSICDYDIEIVRNSYFTFAPFKTEFYLMREWYEAYNLLMRLCEKHKLPVSLNKGDFVLYNNHLMFHSREEFEGLRHLRGVYFNTSDVMNALKDSKRFGKKNNV